MIYFTSDTHFGHGNILSYCTRPFTSIGEHDAELVLRWNERVQPDDTVYHLGDFSLSSLSYIRSVKERLNGYVVLIKGNHDRHTNSKFREMGFEVHKSLALTAPTDLRLMLRHRPNLLPTDHYYDFVLCGHVHTHWTRRGKYINVGVDRWDFRPVTLTELLSSRDETPAIQLPLTGTQLEGDQS